MLNDNYVLLPESETTMASSWTGDPPDWMKANVSPPLDGPVNIPSSWPAPHELKPHKCPVCEGSGVVMITIESLITTPTKASCHGCNGKGWVTV